jgi:ribonuclease P protein component
MKSVIKIKENRDFRRAYAKGKALVSPYAVVYVLKNRFGSIRLGITTGKKIGNAVKRNRAKRVIRAAFEPIVPHIDEGYDFVIVARTRILNVKSQVVSKAIYELLRSADLCEEL